MAKWMELHELLDGSPILFNVELIRVVETGRGTREGKDEVDYCCPCTIIVYDVDDAYKVEESYNEVYTKIIRATEG